MKYFFIKKGQVTITYPFLIDFYNRMMCDHYLIQKYYSLFYYKI